MPEMLGVLDRVLNRIEYGTPAAGAEEDPFAKSRGPGRPRLGLGRGFSIERIRHDRKALRFERCSLTEVLAKQVGHYREQQRHRV